MDIEKSVQCVTAVRNYLAANVPNHSSDWLWGLEVDVKDGHVNDVTGLLKGYIRGLHSVQAIDVAHVDELLELLVR